MLYHWCGSSKYAQTEYSVFTRLSSAVQIRQLCLFFGALSLQSLAIVLKTQEILDQSPLPPAYITQVFLAGWLLSLPGNLLALQHFTYKFSAAWCGGGKGSPSRDQVFQ